MEISLLNDRIHTKKCSTNECISQEESMEMIVPDSKPDILEIIDCDAYAVMTGKEVDNGRASIRGKAEVTVIYRPENSDGLLSLKLSIPFTSSLVNSDITNRSEVSASCSIAAATAVILNSRKLLVKTEILSNIKYYNTEDIEIPFMSNELPGVYTLTQKKKLNV